MLNFLGIGAQKCGTTWLHDALAREPGIVFPAGKEIHYWNLPQGRSIEWYSTLFNDDTKINGDITPAYSFLPKTTIQKIHAGFPNLRLIYLIRNPMERAWSAARMALGRAEMLHDEASDQWFMDHFLSRGSLARGDYETCIRQWRSVYDPNQLLIIRYETISRDPASIVNTCLQHILSKPFVSIQDNAQLSKKVFEGDGVPLPPRLHVALKRIYSSRIESLSEFLQQDFSNWTN